MGGGRKGVDAAQERNRSIAIDLLAEVNYDEFLTSLLM